MRARTLAGWLLAIAATGAAAQTGEAARVQAWLTGEWNNHEQVWQQRIDNRAPAAAGAAATPAPTAPAVSAVLVSHRQAVLRSAPDGTLKLQWHEGAIHGRGAALASHVWRLAAAEGGRLALMIEGTACTVPLARDAGTAEAWVGSSAAGGCTLGGEKRRVQLRLTPGQIDWLDQTEAAAAAGPPASPPLRLRKQRYFEGWVWFRNAGPGAAADDKDTSFTARIALHSEGQRLVLKRKDGTDSPWELEFAVLTYQNTRRPVLKFGLVDRASGKSIAYTWANTEATNIGLNIGWFQSGLTLRPEGQNLYGD
jgi:hypothetical protein